MRNKTITNKPVFRWLYEDMFQTLTIQGKAHP